ncbi:MAG: deoxyuridine 5'-triphosphate nucleotidohydrolase [Thermoprotei archaeon]|nr:MAG: deoxyuridine 5'-triphosphate nucleotidohydrolase [Thermoprotei archaeon]
MTAWSPEKIAEVLGIGEELLDCAGVKLHLDKLFKFRSPGFLGAQQRELPHVEEVEHVDGVYRLGPGVYRIRYREVIKVPPNAMALAFPRSSLLRMGVTIYTAVWDPGYEGRGEGMLTVFNPFGIELEAGCQVAQLIFIELDRPTKRVYRGAYFRENMV